MLLDQMRSFFGKIRSMILDLWLVKCDRSDPKLFFRSQTAR